MTGPVFAPVTYPTECKASQNACSPTAPHQADDLEAQLVDDGLGPELREILTGLGHRDAPGLTDDDLLQRLRGNKTPCAAALAARLKDDQALAQRALAAFRTAIAQLRELP